MQKAAYLEPRNEQFPCLFAFLGLHTCFTANRGLNKGGGGTRIGISRINRIYGPQNLRKRGP